MIYTPFLFCFWSVVWIALACFSDSFRSISLTDFGSKIFIIPLISVPLRRIYMKLGGNSSYTPPAASYTPQAPQKQPEILKLLLFCFLWNISKSFVLDLDVGFQTFGAGSRAENSHRIRIWGPFTLFQSSRVEDLGKTKTIKIRKNRFMFLYIPFKGTI